MILDLTIENLLKSGCTDKEANALFTYEDSYITNSSGATLYFFVSRAENKFYTGIDYFRKTYLYNGDLRFPLHEPTLVPEYFELAKAEYLEQQKTNLGAFFNSQIIFDEFVKIEIEKMNDNIVNWEAYKDYRKNMPSIKNNPYNNTTAKQIRIFKNYIEFLKTKKAPQHPEAKNDEVTKVLHPEIFKDNAFEIWQAMFDEFNITKSNYSIDVDFMFQVMKYNNQIHDTIGNIDMQNWVNKVYEMSFIKIRHTNHKADSNKMRLIIYNQIISK